MKWVLGPGGSNDYFSATLLKNGTPHSLIEDERLTRHRYGDPHWASSPCKASALYCLENAGIEFSDWDGIFISSDIEGVDRFWEDFTFHEMEHHLCHASAAYFTSPFERYALVPHWPMVCRVWMIVGWFRGSFSLSKTACAGAMPLLIMGLTKRSTTALYDGADRVFLIVSSAAWRLKRASLTR